MVLELLFVCLWLAEDKDETLARSYLSELKNIRLRLEECEQRLVSRIQSPSSARADGDTIQENAIRMAEQEVRPAAGRWAGRGEMGKNIQKSTSKSSCSSSVWAKGAGFEGISLRRRQRGAPAAGLPASFPTSSFAKGTPAFSLPLWALLSRCLPPAAAHAGGSAAAAVRAAGCVPEVLQLPGQSSCRAQHAPSAFRAGLGGEQDGADTWAVFHLPGKVSRDVPLLPNSLLSVPSLLKAVFCPSNTPCGGCD